MSDNTKIRTMKNDLEEVKRDIDKQTEKDQIKKDYSTVTSTQKSSNPNNTKQEDFSDEKNDFRNKELEEREEETVSNISENNIEFYNEVNEAQSNELKSLINKISQETDNDPDESLDFSQKKSNEIKDKNDIVLKENDIEKKVDLQKSVTRQIRQTEKDSDNIEALKTLINKISNSGPGKENIKREIKPKSEPVQRKFSEKKKEKIDSVVEQKISSIENKSVLEQKNRLEEKIKSERKNDLDFSKIDDKTNIVKEKEEKREKKKNISTPTSISVKEKSKKTFWTNISSKIKKVSNSEKINELSNKKDSTLIKDSAKMDEKKNDLNSGVLQNKKQEQNKQREKDIEERNARLRSYYNRDYVPPVERLIRGKQEFYSSVSKKIEQKDEKGEMEILKNTAEIKKSQKEVTKDEEYKKLKKSIIQKYHINLAALPWKKIIVFSVVILSLVGVGFYFLYSNIKKPEIPKLPKQIVVGTEIDKFKNIDKEITITAKELKGFASLDTQAKNIFASDENIKVIKLKIIDNNSDRNMLALQDAFDAIGVIDVKNNKNNLPENFLKAVTDNYNLFIFQTQQKTIRYALAIKTDDADLLSLTMDGWEKEKTKNKKMTTILKPLFIDDASKEDEFKPFSSAVYKGVEIKYVHIVDKDTALNYFIYDNILVITTSKDSTFTMIDLITAN